VKQRSPTRRVVLAVTGASGMPYAVALARELARAPAIEPPLILSAAAQVVLSLESKVTADELAAMAHACYGQADLDAPPASGSWRHAGMVVCPCSMASLAAIASGLGSNLIHRAADVALKERRPLILVPRETPLNRMHLKNMLAAHEAGAEIIPACPGFYHRPETVDDLVRFVAARVLDRLGIGQTLVTGWKEENA
jgi:4-hydroxy-3-polyprenylbenzoate decarboxylase